MKKGTKKALIAIGLGVAAYVLINQLKPQSKANTTARASQREEEELSRPNVWQNWATTMTDAAKDIDKYWKQLKEEQQKNRVKKAIEAEKKKPIYDYQAYGSCSDCV